MLATLLSKSRHYIGMIVHKSTLQGEIRSTCYDAVAESLNYMQTPVIPWYVSQDLSLQGIEITSP